MKPNPDIFKRANAIANNPMSMMEYLFDATVKAIESTDGTGILEIGTHKGGSALVFLDAIEQANLGQRCNVLSDTNDVFLVTVDPWGGKPYPASCSLYDDVDQWDAMREISAFVAEHKLRWHHYKQPSLMFLEKNQDDGCWYGGERYDYKWAMAFLDGEHIVETVINEIDMVIPYMAQGGVIIVDNANHIQVDEERPEKTMQTALELKANMLGIRSTFTQHEGDLICELTGF